MSRGPGHKAILIGERRRAIKEIGARARQELARLLERPVHLFLNVKERPGWDEEAPGCGRSVWKREDSGSFTSARHRGGFGTKLARFGGMLG